MYTRAMTRTFRAGRLYDPYVFITATTLSNFRSLIVIENVLPRLRKRIYPSEVRCPYQSSSL